MIGAGARRSIHMPTQDTGEGEGEYYENVR
jgi:hypothetical protein